MAEFRLTMAALSGIVRLLNQLGINLESVSDAIKQAHQEGRDLSGDALADLVESWESTDQAEAEAYRRRMSAGS